MSRTLDVAALPFDQSYECKDGTVIDLRKHLGRYYPVVGNLAAAGLVKGNDSFGFAMAAPTHEGNLYRLEKLWDNPEKFTWFVGGWGPSCDRYIANALRKLRPLLREGGDSTLDLRLTSPALFSGKVESANPDGTFSWGDFGWGGATRVSIGKLFLIGAASGLSETQDDVVTKLILGGLAEQIILGDGLLTDD